ncbi:zinc finger protein Gfi-1 [Clonorchis sinensis]|uniref:Zinc finger protein Gfi-1 n=1 Tax=Clonorchis sinensis TaxID=79923 RepID=G7YQ45_CLOSI|nr:zinc finger protein Gfi-1 [Clonorchis sinensis]
MIEQNLLPGKSLIISSFNPNLSTSQSTNMLTASMTTPAFMTYGRGSNGSDLNLIALMQNMRPEAQNLCRSLAQHLNSTPILELGSPAISQLLAASCKRAAPSLQPAMIEAHQPSTSTEEDVVNGPTQSSSSFSMTAAITSALSSNSVAAGSQLLPACSPLLQLAIRQALAECLPNFSPLTIHGNLEISFEGTTPNGTQLIQSKTVLKFSDELAHHQTIPTAEHCSPRNSPPTSVGFTDATHKYSATNHCNGGSSRRKPLNPTKCNLDEFHSASLPDSTVHTLSPAASNSPVLVGHSGSFTPSTDSGVLDLSRNGSLSGSAPITPMKDSFADPIKSTDQHLLEAYQSHLAAFNQLQSIWSRASTNLNECRSTTTTPTGLFPATNQSGDAYPAMNFSHQLAPNTPVKSARRKVVNRTNSIGRMCALRRPNSNRRFPCNQCREEFPSLHTLEEHTMFQHGTYRCHICKAQFTQRSNLQRHALKHVGFKPFECRVCSKAYYRKDHLMRHMEMGHPGYTPRDNITVHLTSSESLDFLNRSCPVPVNEDVEDSLNNTMIRRDSLMEVDSTPPQPSTPEHEIVPVTSAIDSDNLSPCNDVSTEDRVESDHRDSVYSSTGAPSSVELSERCASSVEDLPPFTTQPTEQPSESTG